MNRLPYADVQQVADGLTAYVSHQQGPPAGAFHVDDPTRPQIRHWADAATTVTTWAFEVRGPNGTFSLHWSHAEGPLTTEWVLKTAKVLCVLAGVTV